MAYEKQSGIKLICDACEYTSMDEFDSMHGGSWSKIGFCSKGSETHLCPSCTYVLFFTGSQHHLESLVFEWRHYADCLTAKGFDVPVMQNSNK